MTPEDVNEARRRLARELPGFVDDPDLPDEAPLPPLPDEPEPADPMEWLD